MSLTLAAMPMTVRARSASSATPKWAFSAKVPSFAFVGLMQIKVTPAAAALDGTGRGNQRFGIVVFVRRAHGPGLKQGELEIRGNVVQGFSMA